MIVKMLLLLLFVFSRENVRLLLLAPPPPCPLSRFSNYTGVRLGCSCTIRIVRDDDDECRLSASLPADPRDVVT